MADPSEMRRGPGDAILPDELSVGGGVSVDHDIDTRHPTLIRQRTQAPTSGGGTPDGPVAVCVECETHYGDAPTEWQHCPQCGAELTTFADGRGGQ